jgi:hypothetical protein
MFWIIVLVVAIVFIVFKVVNTVRGSRKAKKAEEEKQKHKEEERQKRNDLSSRAATGDEAAKQELIELGTNVSDYFSYENFDFDSQALNRLYNLIEMQVVLKGFPQFTMGETEEKIVGGSTASGFKRFISEGKTPRGDTLYIEYRIGQNKPGGIEYKLHLKALPEEAYHVEEMVRKLMEQFLSTVPKWDGKS